MLINKRDKNGITIIEVAEKRIDAIMAPDFNNYLTNEIKNGATKILLDLSIVDFMDSSGLGAIVSGLKNIGGGAIGNLQHANAGRGII